MYNSNIVARSWAPSHRSCPHSSDGYRLVKIFSLSLSLSLSLSFSYLRSFLTLILSNDILNISKQKKLSSKDPSVFRVSANDTLWKAQTKCLCTCAAFGFPIPDDIIPASVKRENFICRQIDNLTPFARIWHLTDYLGTKIAASKANKFFVNQIKISKTKWYYHTYYERCCR